MVLGAELAYAGPALLLDFISLELDSLRTGTGNPNRMESASKARHELERIEEQIGNLESVAGENLDARRQLQQLHEKVANLRTQITSQLNAWEKTELARHAHRPYTLDYIERLFTDWSEIHGDRGFSDDAAIICGMGRFHGEDVAVIG